MSTYLSRSRVGEWISQSEAARLRGVSRQAIARLISRGRIRTVLVAGRRLVNRADAVAFRPKPAGRPKQKKQK